MNFKVQFDNTNNFKAILKSESTTADVDSKGAVYIRGEDGEDGAIFYPSVSPEANLSWTNDKGLENPPTVNIRGPQGLQGDIGLQGPQGPQGERGDKGDKGDTGPVGKDGVGIVKTEISNKGELIITLSDNSISNLGNIIGAQGQRGEQGEKGDKGERGPQGMDGTDGVGIIKAEVNSKGELIIILSNDATFNLGVIMGPKGDEGEQGIQGPQGPQGAQGDKGDTGADGISITEVEISSEGNLIISFSNGKHHEIGKVVGEKGEQGIQGPQGIQGIQGIQGERGAQGEAGHTPQKGVDYFTEQDRIQIINEVLASLPKWIGGNY